MNWGELAILGVVLAFLGLVVFLINFGLDPIATVGLLTGVTALAVQLVSGLRKSSTSRRGNLRRGKNKKKGKK